MIRVCCVCKRVQQEDGSWQSTPLPTGALPTHGYCPACAVHARAELRRILQKRKKSNTA